MEDCGLRSKEHFSFKYFPSYVFVRKIAPKVSGGFGWDLEVVLVYANMRTVSKGEREEHILVWFFTIPEPSLKMINVWTEWDCDNNDLRRNEESTSLLRTLPPYDLSESSGFAPRKVVLKGISGCFWSFGDPWEFSIFSCEIKLVRSVGSHDRMASDEFHAMFKMELFFTSCLPHLPWWPRTTMHHLNSRRHGNHKFLWLHNFFDSGHHVSYRNPSNQFA